MDETKYKVVAVVAEILKMSPKDLDMEMMMGDIDEWDSLNHTLIITALEKEFNVVFDLDQVVDVEGVGDLVSLVQRVNGLI